MLQVVRRLKFPDPVLDVLVTLKKKYEEFLG
jgi:hypothetical protein